MKDFQKTSPANTSAKNSSKSFFSPATIQPKLTIGQPNDPYEKEADAMAEQVMRMPQKIQRQCSDCGEEEVQPKRKGNFLSRMPLLSKKQLMRKSDGEGEASPELSSTLNSTKGSGSTLPDSTNQFMSNAFGNDFSKVKVHTDSKAIQMNQDLNARAFTHGSDVYFNKGEYSPDSASGKSLLAHELTHVVQQSGGGQLQAAPKRIQRSWEGALIGGLAGGLIGGAIGAFAGGLGALVGGLIGLGIGALIGSFFGNDSEEVITEEAIEEAVEEEEVVPLLPAEVQAYLVNLVTRGAIENQTDSDRKARAVIDFWLEGSASYILSSDVQILLIQELITGTADAENQTSILSYFRSVPYEDFKIVINAVGRDDIVNYFVEADRAALNTLLDSRMAEDQAQTADPTATFDSNITADAKDQFAANSILDRDIRQNCIDVVRTLAPTFFRNNPALAATVSQEIGALSGLNYKMTAVGQIMEDLGLTSDYIEMEFENGNGINEPTTMDGSAWDEIMTTVGDQQGWHIFGMALFNGYHSVTLMVHKTATDVFLYWADQWAIDPGDNFLQEDNSVSGFRRYDQEGFDGFITQFTNSSWNRVFTGDPDNGIPEGRRWNATTKIWKFRSELQNTSTSPAPAAGTVQPKRKSIQAQFANETIQKKNLFPS